MRENRKFENYVHLQQFVCDFNLDVENLSILSQFTSALDAKYICIPIIWIKLFSVNVIRAKLFLAKLF